MHGCNLCLYAVLPSGAIGNGIQWHRPRDVPHDTRHVDQWRGVGALGLATPLGVLSSSVRRRRYESWQRPLLVVRRSVGLDAA